MAPRARTHTHTQPEKGDETHNNNRRSPSPTKLRGRKRNYRRKARVLHNPIDRNRGPQCPAPEAPPSCVCAMNNRHQTEGYLSTSGSRRRLGAEWRTKLSTGIDNVAGFLGRCLEIGTVELFELCASVCARVCRCRSVVRCAMCIGVVCEFEIV